MASRGWLIFMLAGFLVGVGGCYHYAAEYRPLAEVLAAPQDRVRVTLADSTQLILYSARAVGDSLIGWSAPPTGAAPANRVAMAIAEVRLVELHRMDVPGTAGAAFIGALWVATLLLGVFIVVIVNALTKAF